MLCKIFVFQSIYYFLFVFSNVSSLSSQMASNSIQVTLPKDSQSTSAKFKFACQYCNKTFSKNFDMQQHERSHTGLISKFF